jgi:hypothetical protein
MTRIAGFMIALVAFAAAADAGEPVRLTGSQLDAVSAGNIDLRAVANGTGEAHGAQTAVITNTNSLVDLGPSNSSLATGQVMSTASSPVGTGTATASSTLSIGVTVP